MAENGQTGRRGIVKRGWVTLDPDACYRALVAHDARFDGAFFTGVRTTGVYCRPVCRARTPRRDSCVFFPRAALAELAGFRACFRCRPERAPGHASVDAVTRLVAAASRRIDEGALNEGSVEDLADALGTSSRHLRRAMQTELGVGPVELASSRRLALARELLLGTTMPITEIAFASGFASVRRFNSAYRDRQRMTPSDVRRPSAARAHGVRIVLDVRPPFDPASAFSFMRARRVVPAEAFIGDAYVRATSLQGKAGLVTISAAKNRDAVVVEVSPSLAPALMAIAVRVRRMFDTNADLAAIGAHLATDPLLRKHVTSDPARRVIGAFDPFEWATRAVLGQQVSVRAALTLGGRLVERFGLRLRESELEGVPTHVWPDAARLAEATATSLASIGLTGARARTLSSLAKAVADGCLVLDPLADHDATRATLLALPGVGPWTAEYIMLRCLGWPDAFPAGDLGIRKALDGATTAECERRSERWRPWRAYAATHLWAAAAERRTGGQEP